MSGLIKMRHVIALAWGVTTFACAAPVHEIGCFESSGCDLYGREYAKGLGPLVEWSDPSDKPGLKAVRPLFAREFDPALDRTMTDILWPVGHIRRWGAETDWRFLSAFYFGPRPVDPPYQYRFWILPIMALGRDQDGESYGAVFPLGGRIDNWFGRDRVEFVFFPLYWHSELNDLRTDHWLWPFISRTTGDDLYRFRVFPFYGRSEKKGIGENKFILWPFWTQARFDRPGHKGNGFMFFPIYGHSKREDDETWMFLPPFFRHSTGSNGTENVYLWPFIQSVDSREMDKFYVWPFYGRRTTSDETRRFWLWPFIWDRHETRYKEQIDRFRIFPFYHSEVERPVSSPTNVVGRYVAVWPLVSYDRIKDDYKRVRVPDLWPFRNTPPIERNLTPLWTLGSYERTARGRETELLWGAARWGSTTNGAAYGSVFPLASWEHDRTKDTYRKWDFLKGLVGYERNSTGKVWRVLYLGRWRTKP